MRFLKGIDLTPEQRAAVMETHWQKFRVSVPTADPNVWLTTKEPVSDDEARETIEARAWCFDNRGEFPTAYAGHSAINADAADAQNAWMITLEKARKAKRILGNRREIGKR